MNKKSTSRQFTSARETFKTILLTGLLLSLVVLVVVYVGGMRAYEEAVSKNDLGENFDRLWSVVSDSESEGLDASHLLPELIGYKQSTSPTPLAIVASADGISELYDLAKPCILELFGSSSVCSELSLAEGKHRLAAAKASDEFVYLRYHEPVLYQLIYAYAADTLTVSESDVATGNGGNVGAYISELVIIPDNDFAAHRFIAYATDGDGRYFEFRPGEHVLTSVFYISKLATTASNIATFPLYFSSDPRFTYDEPIVDGEIEYTAITASNIDTANEALHDALLDLFEYNKEKLDGYADSTGYVYVDTHSQLRIEEGEITFQTTDASASSSSLRGIRIDSLLGYVSSDASSLFDKLTAVDSLVRRLGEISPELVGGNANVCLGEIYSRDSLLVIEYFLTYNGVRIGGEPYLRAVLTEETICELKLHPVSIAPSEATGLSLSPSYILDSLDKIGRLDEGRAIDSIRLSYTDGDAVWSVIYEN